MKKRIFVVLVFFIGYSLNGCASINEISGFMPPKTDIDKLKIGVHDKKSVTNIIGEPLNKNSNHLNSWVYAQQKSETLAFFEPKVKERKILDLTFDKKNILSHIDKYEIRDGKKIEPAKKQVVTEGRRLTFWQQMFGNVGNLSGEQFIN
jgi:outer membrane protein assembly factor BamE (lipoprotein component of BamABCDE complex)